MDEELIQRLVQQYGIEREMAIAAVQANSTTDIEILFSWAVQQGESQIAKQNQPTHEQEQQLMVQNSQTEVQQAMKPQPVSIPIHQVNADNKQPNEDILTTMCSFDIQRQAAETALKINPSYSLEQLVDWCVMHAEDWQDQLAAWQRSQQKAEQLQKQSNSKKLQQQTDEQIVIQLVNFGVAQNLARKSLTVNTSRKINELYEWCQLAESSANFAQPNQFNQFGQQSQNIGNANFLTEQQKLKMIMSETEKQQYNETQIKQKLKGILKRVRQIREQRLPQQKQLRKQYLARYGATEEEAKKKIYEEISRRRAQEKRQAEMEELEKIKEYQKLRQQNRAEQERLIKEEVFQKMNQATKIKQSVRLTQEEAKFQTLADQLVVLNKAKIKAPQVVEKAYETLTKIMDKIINNFDEDKYRKMKEGNLRDRLIGDYLNGQKILQQIGFQKIGEFFILPENDRTLEQLKTIQSIITKYKTVN